MVPVRKSYTLVGWRLTAASGARKRRLAHVVTDGGDSGEASVFLFPYGPFGFFKSERLFRIQFGAVNPSVFV